MALPHLADLLKALNRGILTERRPDMVTVLSRGVVSYAVRFAGDSSIADWLPPQQGPRTYVAPVLVHLITTATTAFALNRTIGYLIGQLAFFAPDVPRPDFNAIIEHVPPIRNVIVTYQPNLAGAYVEINEPAPIMMPPHWVEAHRVSCSSNCFTSRGKTVA
jgi:hypothetical protein